MNLAFYCAAPYVAVHPGIKDLSSRQTNFLSPSALALRFPDRSNIQGLVRALAPCLTDERVDLQQPTGRVEFQLLQKSLALKSDLQANGLIVSFDTVMLYPLSLDWEKRAYHDFMLAFDFNHLLVSIPEAIQDPVTIMRQIWRFAGKGYVPVIMQVEQLFHRFPDAFLEQMKLMGCKFQMDLRALSTFYGKDVQAQAKKMLQARMINYITTNFEEEDYTARLERALKHPLLIEYMRDADLCSHYYKKTVLVYTGEGAIKKPSLLSFL